LLAITNTSFRIPSRYHHCLEFAHHQNYGLFVTSHHFAGWAVAVLRILRLEDYEDVQLVWTGSVIEIGA
jgi:hypothetical protein